MGIVGWSPEDQEYTRSDENGYSFYDCIKNNCNRISLVSMGRSVGNCEAQSVLLQEWKGLRVKRGIATVGLACRMPPFGDILLVPVRHVINFAERAIPYSTMD
jgi:hypothetical protein